ncbi:pseudouridine synthase, partial [Pseudooceanicola sediminis]|uniref:pseudouridine synthase n=1 Tax=Pseudooceanicola sediminis TaxID=2211117 RepID=UPI001F3CA1E2
MTRKPTPRPDRPAASADPRAPGQADALPPDTGAEGVPERSAGRTAGATLGTGASAGTGADAAGRPGDRIAKVLSRAGVASRRDAEKMIAEGRVAVNGKVIDSPALNITGGARITVDGRPIAAAEPARLWLYHKPTGLVTTTKDEQGRATIFDTLPEDMPRVLSVGRLDLNSEGLLLLTNDGGIKRQLELPSTGWLRRYRVRVKGAPTDEMLAPLREGIVVDREEFQPMIVSVDRQQGANAWLTVALREGKNREIRRAMENIGLVVNRLIRVSYGPFQLGTLKAGAVEEVKRRVMRDQLGLEPEEEDTTPAPRKRLVRKSKPSGVGSDITEETFGGRGRTGGRGGPKAAGGAAGKPGARSPGKPGARS